MSIKHGRAIYAPTVLVRNHLWIWWAEIAIEQEDLARHTRARAVEITPSGDGFADLLWRETRAAMIAIAACSHSLDALFGAVRELVPEIRTPRRRSTILETLKAGFEIRGSAAGGRWAGEFNWLFDLRDAALHFEESQAPTVPHPTGTNTGPENVLYSLEPAERAVSLLIEVLDTCTANPRPALVEWATAMRPTAESLSRRESALGPGRNRS
jgi:hypothetical protein